MTKTKIPYLSIKADNNYELGLVIGKTIRKKIKINIQKKLGGLSLNQLNSYIRETRPYLKICTKYLPSLIDELKGLSDGANVSFEHIFLINCREVFDKIASERCTTVLIRQDYGYYVGHNEDWEEGTEADLYSIQATVNNHTLVGLNYSCELLGNAIFINSHGVIQAINDLSHKEMRLGIPKNFIARKILETKNIQEILAVFRTYPRASGFNHVIVAQNSCLNIETTASYTDIQEINIFPFIHTNHYLGKLKIYENWRSSKTFERYIRAKELTRQVKNKRDLRRFLANTEGYPVSIWNDETIASVIVDLKHKYMEIVTARDKSIYSKYRLCRENKPGDG